MAGDKRREESIYYTYVMLKGTKMRFVDYRFSPNSPLFKEIISDFFTTNYLRKQKSNLLI